MSSLKNWALPWMELCCRSFRFVSIQHCQHEQELLSRSTTILFPAFIRHDVLRSAAGVKGPSSLENRGSFCTHICFYRDSSLLFGTTSVTIMKRSEPFSYCCCWEVYWISSVGLSVIILWCVQSWLASILYLFPSFLLSLSMRCDATEVITEVSIAMAMIEKW